MYFSVACISVTFYFCVHNLTEKKTKNPFSFQNTTATSIGLSDHHKLVVTMMKQGFGKICQKKYNIEIINNLII